MIAFLVAGTGLEPVSASWRIRAQGLPTGAVTKKASNQKDDFSSSFNIVAGTGLEPVTFGL